MSGASARQVREVVRELGGRLAVAGALVVALVALVQHAPLWLACARGAGTLFLLTLGSRLGAAALERAIDSDESLLRSKKEQEDRRS